MTRNSNSVTAPVGRLAPRRLQSWTYVDQVTEVIIADAAMGVIAPGDRINELELSRKLGISRAPIREAIRSLVAQGVIESVAYQGVRLAALTQERIAEINEVRLELEKLALRKLSARPASKQLIAALEDKIEDMRTAVRKQDRLALVRLDADFHEAVVAAAENVVLLKFWQILKPQLIIMFGVMSRGRPMRRTVDEHREILRVFASHRWKEIEATLAEHIVSDNLSDKAVK